MKRLVTLVTGMALAVAVTVPLMAQSWPSGEWKVAVISTDDAVHAAEAKATQDGNMWTITAGGDDIWNAADQFTYVYKEVSGDVDAAIVVHSLELTNDWSKAGVMVRQTLEPGSVNVYAATRGANNLVTFQQRPVADAACSSRRLIQDGDYQGMPVGIRLMKSGDVFTGDYGNGGVNWSGNPMHNDGTPTGAYTVSFTAPYYVGIAVTSHTAGVIAEAVVEVINDVTTAVEPAGKLATTWSTLKK
ncbi:MAG: hypothetical protein O3A46_04115 [Candidatus Poribacteria bacterium]|nr:hypothetical protein [Candidatus Poribacteria bacterium]